MQFCFRFRVAFGWFSVFVTLLLGTSVPAAAAFQSYTTQVPLLLFVPTTNTAILKSHRRLQPRTASPEILRNQKSTIDHTSRLYAARPQDNLVAGIAEIGFAFSLGVLWSEYSVALTGCGPTNFSDTLERICYQGVIVFAGVALFNRIVKGTNLAVSSEEFFGPLEEFTLVQVRISEWASALAVVGAFLALAFQYSRGAHMDGMSGIDESMCRALSNF